MKIAASCAFALLIGSTALAQAQAQPRPSGPVQQKIAPGMDGFTDDVLFGQVWPGPGLSQRDRSLIVISALIATNKPAQLRGHLNRALDNGITPVEASGVLTHLAFYAGWPNAVSALAVFDEVYTARKIDFAVLQAAMPALPASGSAPAQAKATSGRFAGISPLFAQLSNDVIADDLWRRADLNLRDRSLVTIAALTAMGETGELPAYLRRGLDAGLTQAQIGEAMTHLAFYAGWPRATAALDVATATFPATAAAPVAPAPAASGNFTGTVSVTEPFQATGGSSLRGATVTFAPAARTKWHSHAMGQLLVVTTGRGWTQIEGEPVRVMEPRDVIWTPPGAVHWHGATRATGVAHVAVSEGGQVTWLHEVSDAEFQGPD